MGQFGRTTVWSYLIVNQKEDEVIWNIPKNASLTPGSGIPSPMTMKQVKTSDAASIRCPRVRADPKRASLDAIPRGQITPLLENIEMFL